MRRLIVLAAFALCACGGEDKNAGQPAPPDPASNFNGPVDARGAAPQWSLKIRGLDFTLTRDNQPDLAGKAPGATLSAHKAVWNVALPNSQSMQVSLYGSPCTDAVTGTVLPFAAEVVLPGGGLLTGCAGKPAGTR